MTMSSGNACREMRQLLGVYVVGAIDPAERAVVDEHLGQCPSCRDELAGLAGLPAMLSRVPAADVERLSLAPTGLPEMTEPPAELLNSLLRRVSATRRTRMWRGALAVAAAVVIAAGGAAVATELARPAAAHPAAGWEVARGASASTHVAAVVDYMPTAFGTAMRVQVSGIKPGTTCRFWVIGKNGKTEAGSWTVQPGYGSDPWYPAASLVPPHSVGSFQISAGSKVLVTIHAS
ncbi:MAG: anti-sigma factor family protein [Streptosporangiaceae bacterium]